MNEHSQVMGTAFPVMALGRTYHLSQNGQRIKAAFCQWCTAQSLKAIRKMERIMSPREHQSAMAAITEGMAQGDYEWEGQQVQTQLFTLVGNAKFLALLMEAHHPEASEELARQILEDNPQGVRLALEQLLQAGPNSPPPQTAGANPSGE